MSEPNSPIITPESLIREGVAAHRQGDLGVGLEAAEHAFNLAVPGSVEQGHAARDAGARALKLGFIGKAKDLLKTAYDIHLANVLDDRNNREAVRNLGASATMFATGNLLEHIENGTDPMSAPYNDILGPTRQAEHSLKQANLFAKGLFKLDQFLINMARRISVNEAFAGDRRKALSWSFGGVAVAPFSESKMLDTSNPNLSRGERMKAKARALAGGLGAVAVATTARTKFDGFARKTAKKIS